ncbi:MAG: hypothetical protein C7B46_20820 [Sulfobacillus benefaciens]|uniref:Flp family type IVb pilin n=1 Tax=Sulfobacillus benefaciens TaxID=453960 RepID=A0A2T2WS22_9FIRM|nr:MAG: hypothetical protein C7B46_20820 [Sulfobacillus benefaciens]
MNIIDSAGWRYRLIPRLIRDRSGQSLVEYTLILVLVSIVGILALGLIGHVTGSHIHQIANKIPES